MKRRQLTVGDLLDFIKSAEIPRKAPLYSGPSFPLIEEEGKAEVIIAGVTVVSIERHKGRALFIGWKAEGQVD